MLDSESIQTNHTLPVVVVNAGHLTTRLIPILVKLRPRHITLNVNDLHHRTVHGI